MKRTRPSEVKQLLAERNILPSRVLGQNFLIDQNILQIILESAHLNEDDHVLEIGPGLGVLTEHLVRVVHHVTAIEKDPRLAAYLREAFAHCPDLQLIEGDALEADLPGLVDRQGITHVISNLPYSSGTRMLVELVDCPDRPLRFVVMLQSDVAERLVAPSGSKAYGILSIHAQLHYDVWIRKTVSPSCFYPPPEVRSALVELYRRDRPMIELRDETHFRELVKWSFSQRRKQLGTILQKAPQSVVPDAHRVSQQLAELDIVATLRPEQINIVDWGRLSNTLHCCLQK